MGKGFSEDKRRIFSRMDGCETTAFTAAKNLCELKGDRQMRYFVCGE